MSTDLQTTNQSNRVVSHPSSGGIGITGLESIPTSMLGMPYIKVVQPTSQNVELADGKEAPAGTFHFSDLQQARESIEISLITAKRRTQRFENEGEVRDVEQVAILFKEHSTGGHYIMSLSVTSFKAFGNLMSLITSEVWSAAWDKKLTLTTEKQERQGGGKYFTVKFQVGDKLSEEEAEVINADWLQYGGYFERDDEVNEDVDPNSVTI